MLRHRPRSAPKTVPPHSAYRSAVLRAAFDQVWAALVARKPELDSVDISHAIEVVADRYILANPVGEFSRRGLLARRALDVEPIPDVL